MHFQHSKQTQNKIQKPRRGLIQKYFKGSCGGKEECPLEAVAK